MLLFVGQPNSNNHRKTKPWVTGTGATAKNSHAVKIPSSSSSSSVSFTSRRPNSVPEISIASFLHVYKKSKSKLNQKGEGEGEEISMRGSRGRVLWALRRRKVGFPLVVLSCSLFFIAGFFRSVLFSQDPSGEAVPRARYMETAVGEGVELFAMPHGESGEPHPSPVSYQVLSWKPRALYFPKFASAKQCQTIIQKAKSQLKPSSLALRKGETEAKTKGVRTSSGTFVSASEDSTGTLNYIEQKIARVTMLPRDHGEAFNILRYEIGQRYASHYDAFNPSEYGPQKSQRVASFLLYLSDVEEGGETMFPYENGENMDIGYDYEKCIGLKVKPRQGDGLLFYSLFTNGTIDPTSLHGSCPVIKGEKWVATKWIRDQKN